MTTTALSVGSSRAQAVKAALFALSLGAALIFVVGFAYPSAIHNAAHDTRHSMSFPCH
jgi:cobalt transporter subunit CbtB